VSGGRSLVKWAHVASCEHRGPQWLLQHQGLPMARRVLSQECFCGPSRALRSSGDCCSLCDCPSNSLAHHPGPEQHTSFTTLSKSHWRHTGGPSELGGLEGVTHDTAPSMGPIHGKNAPNPSVLSRCYQHGARCTAVASTPGNSSAAVLAFSSINRCHAV
jgi:hypothetical protein